MTKFTIVEKRIDELEVSTSNPRFVQIVMDESTAINQLINLDLKKMIKLVKSVIEKGVLPLPFYAFKEKDQLILADGNRRLTVIKILRNPSIIPRGERMQELIKLCEDNKDKVSLPERMPCVIYERWTDDLFDILNSLHVTDESKSDWTPLAQYRLSSRHGGNKYLWMKTLLFHYNDSNKVDEMTNKKADVFSRMFAAMNAKKIKILETGEIQLEGAKECLDKFAHRIKNNYLNTRSSQEEFQNAVQEIFLDRILLRTPKYFFSISNTKIYRSQVFSLQLIGFCIKDETGKSIRYNYDDVEIQFFNMIGEGYAQLNTTQVGKWKINIKYNGCEQAYDIEVIDKKELCIVLTNSKVTVTVGNSVNLRTYIKTATDAFGQDITNKIKIKSVKNQNLKINNDVFSGDMPAGRYLVQYFYKDMDGECSKTLIVEVCAAEDSYFFPLLGINSDTKLLSWGTKPVAISFNNTVAALINEINKLDFNEYPNLISCALRSMFELSYDTLIAHAKISQNTQVKHFKDKLKIIIDALSQVSVLTYICNADKITFSFDSERNFLNTFTDEKLNAINGRLNNATHKAGQGVNFNEIKENMKKDFSRLLALINQWLN